MHHSKLRTFTEYEELVERWEALMNSVFSLGDKIEAYEKFGNIDMVTELTELRAKRRAEMIALDLRIHEERGMGKYLLGNEAKKH